MRLRHLWQVNFNTALARQGLHISQLQSNMRTEANTKAILVQVEVKDTTTGVRL